MRVAGVRGEAGGPGVFFGGLGVDVDEGGGGEVGMDLETDLWSIVNDRKIQRQVFDILRTSGGKLSKVAFAFLTGRYLGAAACFCGGAGSETCTGNTPFFLSSRCLRKRSCHLW